MKKIIDFFDDMAYERPASSILVLILCVAIFVGCTRKPVVAEEPENDFLKVPEYTEASVEKPKANIYTPTVKNTVEFSSGDSTYWYVEMTASNINWHGTVTLATPYFDFREARKQFADAKGKGYFKFILQINKESRDSFENYNE